MFKQVSLPKIRLILQNMKISSKSNKRPFCTNSFHCFINDNASVKFSFLATALSRVQGVEPEILAGQASQENQYNATG